MDYLNLTLTFVGIPGALLAAWKAIDELRHGNLEKARENRLKQAAAAKSALDEVFGDARARAALRMLDWSGRSFDDGGNVHTVQWGEIGPALTTDMSKPFPPKAVFIRDCFESLFDRLQLIEHYVAIGYLNLDDVAVPFAYYARKIVTHIDKYGPFLDGYGYAKVKSFLAKSAR